MTGSVELKRRQPSGSGVYVEGMIEDMPLTFTADTGASRSIVSRRVYEQLKTQPMLKGSALLKGAGGAPIKEWGQGTFRIKLGPVELTKQIIVADIEDEALLGYDILAGGIDGPADILLSRDVIVLEGKEIPCYKNACTLKARKVVVADDVNIPGHTEALIHVYVERKETDDDDHNASFVVEPTEDFRDRYQLMLASTLVDINASPTSQVRILNPFPDTVTLKQNAVVACAEKIVDVVSVVVAREHTNEEQNNASIRRVECISNEIENGEQLPSANEADIPEHLLELFNRSAEGKSGPERAVLAGLLGKYESAFSKDEWDIGLTHLTEHPISTGDAAPVKQRPRRLPLAHADHEKKAIEDLIKKGVIEKSTSPWASPIVLVKKKSGAIRPCVDYRRVNALVRPDGFPLPRVQDCLDAVADSVYFSSFDLTSGYFQIPLKAEDKPKSAFVCKYGQYQMTRMPFGLNNAASTFQRTMEIALQGLQWETCLVYIDDIIVYGNTFEQHMLRVDQVLKRIQDAGLKLKPDKCHLLKTEVIFLGHVVSKEGVKPDPSNIAKIVQWTEPTNPKQVKQFVATASYYRRFVDGFAKIARPLLELTKQGVDFKWTEACNQAFVQLKQALISPNIMGYPLNHGGSFYLDVDASGIGIGGVLAQEQGGHERVISYASRALSKAEKNYCITEQELLAVVYFIQYFRQYLLGRRFIVRTDHQALVWLFSMKEPSGKIARWIEILAQYDFSIEYRAGRKQPHCDGLSRCGNPKDCTCPEVDTSEPLKCGPCAKCRRRAEMMDQHINIADKDVFYIQSKPTNTDPFIVGQEVEQNRPEADDLVKEQSVNPDSPVLESTPIRGLRHADDDGKTHETESTIVIDDQMPGTSREDSGSFLKLQQWVKGFSASKMADLQQTDPDIGLIYRHMLSDKRPTSEEMSLYSAETRHYWVIWELLTLRNGLLYKILKKVDQTDTYLQLIIPRSLRQDVLSQCHDPITAGHLGIKKTRARLAQSFYWFNAKADVRNYVVCCNTCASDKRPNKTPRAPMGHIQAGAPWDVLAIDFTGSFPVTNRGNRYIMVATDHFSKYVEVIPVPNQTAEECANRLVNDVIARWGTPLSIHTDQGGTFESKVFKELCHKLEIRKTRTSARNPRANGQVERFNRTLMQMVRAYLTGEQDDWDRNLGCLAGAYRSTPQESTKLTPNMLVLGREIRMPAEVIYSQPQDINQQVCDSYTYIQGLEDRMRKAHEVARHHLNTNAVRSKEIYDSKLSFRQYMIGDAVWCLHETRRIGICPKLEKQYEGPYIIKEKWSPINFVLQLNVEGHERVVHHNKLKEFVGKDLPKWIVKAKYKLKKQ